MSPVTRSSCPASSPGAPRVTASWGVPCAAAGRCSASSNWPTRSTVAAKPASASNWYTTSETSPRMWLKAELDWLMTPNSISPRKKRGATTAAGRKEMMKR